MPSFPPAPTSPVTASACPWTPATRGHCCVKQSCARIRCRKVGYSPALRPARAAHSPHHPHGCPCRVQLIRAVGGAEGVTARSPSSPPRLGQPDWAAFATRKDEGRTRSSQLGSVWPPSGAVPRGPLTSSVQGCSVFLVLLSWPNAFKNLKLLQLSNSSELPGGPAPPGGVPVV